MSDEIFRINCLVLIKEHFLDYARTCYWLNTMVQYVDNEFKDAFLQGAYDYVSYVNEVKFEPVPEKKLKESWYPPSLKAFGTEQDFRRMHEDALPQWIYYNIYTRGCLEVC